MKSSSFYNRWGSYKKRECFHGNTWMKRHVAQPPGPSWFSRIELSLIPILVVVVKQKPKTTKYHEILFNTLRLGEMNVRRSAASKRPKNNMEHFQANAEWFCTGANERLNMHHLTGIHPRREGWSIHHTRTSTNGTDSQKVARNTFKRYKWEKIRQRHKYHRTPRLV